MRVSMAVLAGRPLAQAKREQRAFHGVARVRLPIDHFSRPADGVERRR
jgi:hypothetical protein